MAATVDPRVVKANLRKVGQAASQHRKAREAARAKRDVLDAIINTARKSGGTYREIAAAAGVSTAWVQAALERSGYKTKPR